MKKIICIALSCCMLSSLTQAVFADNYEDEAINYLVENEIVVGDEFGNAMESDPILREQMVSIIGRIGNFSQSRTEGLEEYFTDAGDVSDWAYSYVLEGFEAAYIDGYPDGTFKPQQGMTYEEAIKFTLCAFMQMAETDSAEYIKANYIYPDDYIQLAQDNGYLQDIEVVKGEWMPRGEVFKLLYSVIQNPYPVSDSEEPDINSEREYAWNNSSDFSDEDKDTIEEILDNNVITLDNNNNMNVDEEVSVDDINISLANFVGGVNKDYDLNLPAENLKVNSTDVDDIGTVVNNYINSFDSEEETNVIAKGKMVKYLSDPKWNEVLIYQFIDSWKSAHPGEYVTKGFLIALYKNLYKRIHNWTESYTETLNGAGNYLDGAAYYDGVSYYYNSPYSYEQKSDKPNQFYTVTRKGFYKETKGKAQFMAEGGANFFTYGNYVYYTSGSHLYRIKKNGQNNEKLCDNLSISWGVAKICVDENKLYYKQNDELYSINLADIHSERTFNENSQKVFNDYNTDILVKDGWIYYGLTRRNIKTKDEEIIHTASESSPLLDMNVVDENIYLGRQGIASSYIEKINIENGNYYSIILFDESIKGIYCNGCVYPYILSITQEKDYYRIRMCNIRAEMLINIKYIDKEEAYYAFMTLITYTNEKMRMKLTDIICSVNHSYTKDPYKEVHTYLDKKYGKEALTKQDIAPLFINNKAICWIKKNDNNYLYFKFKDEKIYDYCNKIMNIKKL